MIILLLACTTLVPAPRPKKQRQNSAARRNQPTKQEPTKQQGKVLSDNWPQQTERDRIMSVINNMSMQAARQESAIREQFTAMGCGGGRSSGEALALNEARSNCENAIIQYLRQLGTPVSYQIYKEMFEKAG